MYWHDLHNMVLRQLMDACVTLCMNDLQRCQRVAEAFEAGIVWVNCAQPTFIQAPWGGVKVSAVSYLCTWSSPASLGINTALCEWKWSRRATACELLKTLLTPASPTAEQRIWAGAGHLGAGGLPVSETDYCIHIQEAMGLVPNQQVEQALTVAMTGALDVPVQ